MKKIQIFLVVLAILLVGSVIVISARSAKNREVNNSIDNSSNQQTNVVAGKYDALATCLKTNGAVFYGAFWCPHCNNQKEAFGTSKTLLPYVECATPDGKDQTQVCKDKQITGYPTWEFADGSRLSGEIPMETLAQKTGCVLPK